MCSTETNLYLELIKYLSPFVLAFIAFWLSLKSKKKDIDNEKTKELNIVLSNMLDSWYNLNKLSELLQFIEDKNDDLIFPKKYLPFIVASSGTFNDNSFTRLEESIEMLKPYDPIVYYELTGIGQKFDYVKKNYIIPFLKSGQNEGSIIQIINRTFLDRLLNDIETYLRKTSKKISKSTSIEIEKKIEENFKYDFEKLKEEFNQDYYDLIISSVSEDKKHLTLEELKIEFKKPELQKQFEIEFDFIVKKGIDKLVTLISENPLMTIEELQEKLNED